jgi:hypothetical protein
MGNPNPKISEKFLKLTRPIAPIPGDEPLAAKPVAVRIGVSVYESVNRLGKAARVGWLRRVITEAAQRELMGNVTDVSNASQSPGVAQSGLLITGNPAVKDVSPPGPGEKPETTPRGTKRGRKPKGENHAKP